MTHPHNLDAVVALAALDDAATWIQPTIRAEAQSGIPAARIDRILSPDAIARRGEAYATARADLVTARLTAGWAGLTDTAKGLGNSPAPIRVELLDAPSVWAAARREARQYVTQAAHERDLAATGAGDTLRAMNLEDALRTGIDPWRAREAARALWGTDRWIRDVCGGVSPSRAPCDTGPCPRCDTYGLAWETYDPDPARWTVLCTYGCRCRGDNCTCGLPVRAAGATHRWEPSSLAPALIGALSFEQAIDEIRRMTWAVWSRRRANAGG